MADFDVKVVRVTNVYSHPDADRLSIVETTAGDFICISAKLDDGSHRYKVDDLVVYIPEQAVMPEWMLKEMDFWDVNKDKPAFRYVKAKKLRGIFSQGILYPILQGHILEGAKVKNGDSYIRFITENEDVGEFLGINKYEPVVPASMSGQMSGAYLAYTMKYDFDNVQKQWDIFDESDYVIATEKLHGTLIQIIYVPTLEDDDAFGKSKKFLVTSKGMGAKGFVYKNVPENIDNLYVRTLNKMLANGFEDLVLDVLPKLDPEQTLHLFGEVFGEGIQDLGYGSKTPQVKFFDVAIGKKYVSSFSCNQMLEFLELEHVPVLYSGPFDKEKLLTIRDGKDTISNSHIREGIVIKTWTEQEHPRHGRKIAKWVSPDYLLRKNGTEFN